MLEYKAEYKMASKNQSSRLTKQQKENGGGLEFSEKKL